MIKYNFAIAGHPTRGKEVIKLLELMGGENRGCTGICSSAYYHIDDEIIKVDCIVSNHCLYTLEQFEQMYPYKVGEKVLYLNGRKEWVEGIIDKMIWNDNNSTLTYYVNNIDETSAGQAATMFLKPMKQKELKDYLKPGYVVEYDDGVRCVLTQDVHGNVFGVEIHNDQHWAMLKDLSHIVTVYQITSPSNLHYQVLFESSTKKVWERKEVELTMQQIADKFGINVNQLKIKK